MMQKLTYTAQLSQNRLLTGAATPCLLTIPAEGKLQTSLLSSITCISGNQQQGFRMGTATGAAAQGPVQPRGCLHEREITEDLQQMQQTGRQAGNLQDKCNDCTTNRAALLIYLDDHSQSPASICQLLHHCINASMLLHNLLYRTTTRDLGHVNVSAVYLHNHCMYAGLFMLAWVLNAAEEYNRNRNIIGSWRLQI
jgi:hypothetical protein